MGSVSLPRLTLVLTEFPPRIGGMQTHAIYLARRLAHRGYPLEVLTYRSASDTAGAVRSFDEELPFPVKRVLTRLGHHRNLDLIAQEARSFGSDLIYTSTVFYGALSERLGLPVVARSVGNDVLRPWIAWPLRFGSRLVSQPWVEAHLYQFFRRLDYPEWVEAMWRQRRRRVMIESAQAIDCILANSDFTAGLLCDVGVTGERISVLTGGVSASRFAACTGSGGVREQHGIDADATVLLTACRMVKKKGVDFLIDQMEAVVDAFPSAHLLLVGGGRHYRRFRRAARQTAVSDRITFAGNIDHRQIHEYYAAADVFVLASRVQVDPLTGLRDAETMGRVLCEANAAGLPVIAARSGGIPSVIEHGVNGLLFEPDDVESLLTQLRALLSSDDLREGLVEQGRLRASATFDWSHIVREHERCFEELLDDVQEHSGADDSALSGQVRVVLDSS